MGRFPTSFMFVERVRVRECHAEEAKGTGKVVFLLSPWFFQKRSQDITQIQFMMELLMYIQFNQWLLLNSKAIAIIQAVGDIICKFFDISAH